MVSLPINELSNIQINGVDAVSIASRENSKEHLDNCDLISHFQITDEQATKVISLVSEAITMKRGATAINFASLPNRLAANSEMCSSETQTCFIADIGDDYSSVISESDWSPENYRTLLRWRQRLELYNSLSLVVFFDCDDTLWSNGISYWVLDEAVKNTVVTWDNAATIAGHPRQPEDTTPLEYNNRNYHHGNPAVTYAFSATAFADLTLADSFDAFNKSKHAEQNKPYTPVIDLIRSLQKSGVNVGFISAGAYFFIAPMLNEAGVQYPLWSAQGVDPLVVSPDGSVERPLSSLVDDSQADTWKDFIGERGEWVVGDKTTRLVDSAGKTASAKDIIKKIASTNPVSSDEIRIAGVFGDNFDDPVSPSGKGNDDGMIQAAPLIDGALIVNMQQPKKKDRSGRFERAINYFRRGNPSVEIFSMQQIVDKEKGVLVR